MAEYKVEGPDGKIITMEGPDNATDEQILGFAKQQYLANLPPDYSFGQLASKSFDRGLERFKSTYGDVLPAMVGSALGFDDYAKRQMEEAAQSERKIQETMRPQFASFRDVNWANPIDISKFIVETTGEQVVNLAGVLVPGGVGAKVGEKLATKAAIKKLAPKVSDEASKKLASKFAKIPNPAVARGRNIGQISGVFLGSYGLNAPEVFRNIYEQTGSFEPGAAALAGVVNASLDSILPATILNQFGRPGRATIVSEILERSGMSPNLARKAVVQIAGSGVLEGLTEATQEAVSITAENFVQDHSFLFDSEDFERLLEGGVRGTVAGGAFRGVGVAASNLRDKYDKFVEGKKDDEGGDGKEGTAKFTPTDIDTPPTITPPVKPLGEQLELDLEGGMAQGELDFDTGPVVGEQLELEGLGPKPTVGPLVPPVDPRQTELDFDNQTQLPERPPFSNQVPLGPQSELDFEGQPEGQFAPVQRDLFFPSRPESPLTDTPTTPAPAAPTTEQAPVKDNKFIRGDLDKDGQRIEEPRQTAPTYTDPNTGEIYAQRFDETNQRMEYAQAPVDSTDSRRNFFSFSPVNTNRIPKTNRKRKKLSKNTKYTRNGYNEQKRKIINELLSYAGRFYGFDTNKINADTIDGDLQNAILEEITYAFDQSFMYQKERGEKVNANMAMEQMYELLFDVDYQDYYSRVKGKEADLIKFEIAGGTNPELQNSLKDLASKATPTTPTPKTVAPTTPTPKAKPKAKPKATKVDPKLVGKEVEVSVAGVKQKGTYVDIQGTPFITSAIPQERGGGTQSQAIPANAKVKEVKEKPLKSIRQGNPTDQKIINRLKPKKTLGQVLNIIKSSNATAAQKELATLLLTIPNISKTDFKVVENLEFLNDAYGEYNRQQDSIQISNNADVETVLHEAVHAATANLLNKHIRDGVGLTNLGRRIVRLYEEAVAADVNGRFPTELSKIDEFIAESFTNPEFQKFLANSESSTSSRAEDAAYEQDLKSQGVRPNVIRNIMNERRGTNSLLSSLWSKFVNAIKDLLGIENAIFSYSILNDVIALAPELFVGPNKREQAGATQELLFKKSVIQMLQDSGAMAGRWTKEAITPRMAENIAEVIGRQPFADNRAGRSLVRNISNAPQALLDVYAKILSLPQQIEMFGEYLPSLSDIRRFLEIKAFDIKKGREEIERLVAFGESLKDKYTSTTAGKKVFKEWNQVLLGLSGLDTNPDTILADPNGLANLTKENPKAAALVRRYEKLPQDLKNLSRQIVTDLEVRYKKLLDTVLADIERNKDGSMKDFEKAIREQYKARPFYLPFVRKGDYWFEYQTRDGEYGQASADSAANRNIKIKRMKKEDGITDVKLITRDNAMASTAMVSNDYVEALREGLKGIDLTPEQQVTIDSLIKETQIALFPNESLINNRKTRKAVPGYIEDIVFAYADVAPKIVSSTANQQYNKQLVVAINRVGKEANEPAAVDSNLVRAVANNVIGRSGFMLNPIAGDISRLAAYGSYFWFLGFNVSSAIVNITQIPLVVVPYLAGEYAGPGKTGQGKAWPEIQKAMKLYFSGPGKKGFFQTENTGRFAPDATMAPVKIDLETGEKTYLGPNAKLFKPGGKYHDLFNKAEEAAALRRGVGYEIVELNRDLGAEVESGNRIKAKAEKLVGYMFQNSERFNREVTLVAAFEMEMKYGSGNKDVAIQKAIEFTSKVHSHALPEVGPSLFQNGLGKIAFVFKRFAQAQAYLIMKLFYDGPFKFSRNIKNNPNLTEEEKTQLLAEKLAAKKQLAGIYGYSFLMAGAAGVPLYGLMKMIMEGLFDDDDEPFDFDVFVNQAIGDWAYRGPLSYAIGADISRRTGYNNLFFQEDPQRLAEIGLPTYALETMFGPAFSGIRRFGSGFEYLERGQEMRALERFTPTAISNTVKALRQSMEGVRNKNGVKIIEDDPSLYESFMQIIGFTNPEVSEAYARAQALKGPEKKLNQRRQNLLLRYWLASQEGDTDAVKDIKEEMKEFNKKAPPAMRITPATRNRSMKARQKSTNDSVFGINLPKTYKDDMEDIYDIDTGNILDLDIFD